MKRDDQLTPEVVAAMWLFGEDYSRQPRGAKEFYSRLSASRKAVVKDFVNAMAAAFAVHSHS